MLSHLRDKAKEQQRVASLAAGASPAIAAPGGAGQNANPLLVSTISDRSAEGNAGSRHDDEIEALRRRYAGTPLWMRAPNGEPTKLNERQWLQVRTRAFKRWFGDWEAAGHRDFLDGAPIVVLTGEEFRKTDEPLTERVSAWFKNEHQGVARNPVLGEVALTKRGVRDSIAHGLGREKAAAFAAVPAIIAKARALDMRRNWSGRGYDGYTLAAPVQIAEKTYVGVVIVHRDAQTQRFYLQEVILREALQPQPFKTEASTGTSAALIGDHGGAIATLLRNIYSVKPNSSSKVTDANGEPLADGLSRHARGLHRFRPGAGRARISAIKTNAECCFHRDWLNRI